MIRILPSHPRDSNSDDLKGRDRGFVSLPSMLLEPDEARKLEAERWASQDGVTEQSVERDKKMVGRSAGTEFAQVAVPIPRFFPLLPPLWYGGGRRGSPPRGPGPQSRHRSDDKCDAEYARNTAQCSSYNPSARFPGVDFYKRQREACFADAASVYGDCLAGKASHRPFDPTH